MKLNNGSPKVYCKNKTIILIYDGHGCSFVGSALGYHCDDNIVFTYNNTLLQLEWFINYSIHDAIMTNRTYTHYM